MTHQPSEEELAAAIRQYLGEHAGHGVKRVLAHLKDGRGWLVSEKRVRLFLKKEVAASTADDDEDTACRPGAPCEREARTGGGRPRPTDFSRRTVGTAPARPTFLVGPDYVQVLRGQLGDSEVAIVLCGEAHEDAIDVTRKGGYFLPQEGWIGSSKGDAIGSLASLCGCQVPRPAFFARLVKQKCSISKGHAREWARDLFDDDQYEDIVDESTSRLFLAFVERGKKGDAFLVLFETQDAQERDQEDEIDIVNETAAGIARALLSGVDRSQQMGQSDAGAEEDKMFARVHLEEWADLDADARQVNRRRLLAARGNGTDDGGTALLEEDHDRLIEKRKKERLQESIVLFDEFYDELSAAAEDVEVHLILEAPVSPWEVELHREPQQQSLPPAPACIRCASTDSDESDASDPSSDGMGCYADFLFRRMMRRQLAELQAGSHACDGSAAAPIRVDTDVNGGKAEATAKKGAGGRAGRWLHCVDLRDLGDGVLPRAERKLAPDLRKEWERLLAPGDVQALAAARQEHGLHWLHRFNANPEVEEMDALERDGALLGADEKDRVGARGRCPSSSLSLPSFESFFGQCSDILYYLPHLRFLYAPFLASSLGSLETWDRFFGALFLGGTIAEATGMLLREGCVHTRSPIREQWNARTCTVDLVRRNDEQCGHMTHYALPLNVYLKARVRSAMPDPPRTWSSALFQDVSSKSARLADAVRLWTLDCIHDKAADPKGRDDPEGGGEWFVGWLRAVHRDIYDDIDHSDCGELLRAKQAASLKNPPGGKKYRYNLAEITVPGAEMGFQEIAAMSLDRPVPARTEVLAKILVDIYMSHIVDFVTVLKILNLVVESSDSTRVSSGGQGAREEGCREEGLSDGRKPVVVVCYMGAMHTKAVADFFCGAGAQGGGFAPFRCTHFLGKYEWDEDDARKVKLPQDLWSPARLFEK